MPLTPFHYPVAYLVYRIDRRLNLPGLIVGSMFPDFEVPFMLLVFGTRTPHRLVLHSLLGAATVGALLSVLLTVLVYPALIVKIFPLNKAKLKEKCRSSLSLWFSCFLGNISHVLLDVVNHPYNPVFWPFLSIGETPSSVCSALGGMENASLLIHTVLTVLFIALFVNKRDNFWEKLLVE
ncbi:MAG: DUF4184 family protein [Candidatus Bathyarchaeia archaeon]